MKDNNSNLRIILAVAISFVFIIIYGYFQQQNHPQATETQKTQTTQEDNVTSNVTNPSENLSNSSIKNSSSQALNSVDFDSGKIISTISSKDFEVDIDSLGRISQVYLKDKKFTAPKQEGFFDHIKRLFGMAKKPQVVAKLPLLGDSSPKPLEIRFSDIALNNQAFSTSYQASSNDIKLDGENQSIVLTQNLNGLIVKKTITFYPNLKYDVKIDMSNKNISYVVSNGSRPVADADGYAFHGVILKNSEDKLTKIEDEDAGSVEQFKNMKFVASVDRYYTTLFFTTSNEGFNALVDSETGSKNPLPFVSFKGDSNFEGYIGPKDYSELQDINPMLTDVVEYGRITFFAKPVFLLLNFLHTYTGNWGWAIILLTLIVRIILYPLSYKGMVSMQKLKEVAPKMKELQTKYKGEPQKLQAEMMSLYKKHGANPMGGCLPLVLQIPVFFAIYRVLYNAVELKSASWILWIHDLSVMDPYFVLPILMGVSMYMQQTLTPSAITDPTQAKIFKLLPVVFTLFLITFPAGLVLYWTVNNIFSIIQQLLINKMLDRKKALAIAQHKHHSQDENK